MSPKFKDSYLTCCSGLGIGALLSTLSVTVLQTTMLENDPFVQLCRHTLGAMILFGACVLTGLALVSTIDFAFRCYAYAWKHFTFVSSASPRECPLDEAFADLEIDDSRALEPLCHHQAHRPR